MLLIAVNSSLKERDSIYEAVRYAWIVDPHRARQCEFVLAHRQGLVIGVFKPKIWKKAEPRVFPDFPDGDPRRWGFDGEQAADDVQAIYLGKRIPERIRLRGAANPIRFLDEVPQSRGVNDKFADVELLSSCMRSMSKKRPIFSSETDLRASLVNELHESLPGADFNIEATIPNSGKRFDVLITKDGKRVAIELKYPTARYSGIVDGTEFNLKNHSAYDHRRHDILRDIQKIENFCLENNETTGFVIVVTNAATLWDGPIRKDTADREFSIRHGNKATGFLKWAETASAGTTRGREAEINLADTYQFNWKEYSEIGGKNGIFKYLIITVNKST